MSRETPQKRKVDRRAVIAWIGAAGAVMTVGTTAIVRIRDWQDTPGPLSPDEERIRRHDPVPHGYGKDPDLFSPDAPWPLILTPDQLALVAHLADLILPADESAPAPSQIGIADFVNEWVSAPYPDQLRDRAIPTAGLGWLARQPITRSAAAFARLSAGVQRHLLERMSSPETSSPAATEFFLLLRRLVIGGYYTSPAGFADIGYIGNVALPVFPAPDANVTAMIDAQLATLGL